MPLRPNPADETAARLANASALVDACRTGAAVRQSTGAQFMLGFGGESRAIASMRALAQIRERAAQAGLAQPAAAIVSGSVVHVTNPSSGAAVLGVASLHLDRLLPEAAPGQTLLTRQGGDEIKAALGDATLAVATGAATGKKFYALSETALKNLPAATMSDADQTTRIRRPSSRRSRRRGRASASRGRPRSNPAAHSADAIASCPNSAPAAWASCTRRTISNSTMSSH